MHQIVESAVSSGRSLQSPQSGFVHYCYHPGESDHHDTIPIVENFLFALSLLRTKISARVQEARDLIQKLLPFKVGGNFPIYLHEYPNCRDRYLSVQVLVPLYWMQKRFFLVLGNDLRHQLNEVAKELLQQSMESHQEKEAPFQVAIKIAASLKAFGALWQQSDMEKQGDAFLEVLCKQSQQEDFGTWYSPSYVGETLAALQMVYQDLENSPWKHFWDYVKSTWNDKAFAYAGPSVHERQWDLEPKTTLYDLFLGTYSGRYSYRVYEDQPIQLWGAYVQTDREEVLSEGEKHLIGAVAGHRWMVRKRENYSLACLEKKAPIDPSMQKGFHVFKCLWGDENNTHSLVAQGEGATRVSFEEQDHSCSLVFDLAEDIDFTDRSKNREVALFCDLWEGTSLFVNGEKATTFQLGDHVELVSGTLKMRLNFELIEGQGKFFGHIMPANRPAQLNTKGANRYESHDWSIHLRTVKRLGPCSIKVLIDFV